MSPTHSANRHQVIDISFITDDLFELTLERNNLIMTPGDCVALFDSSGNESRPYSLSSGINDEELRFIIRTMPSGTLTTYLRSLKPGDRVTVSAPFGWFHPGQNIGDSPCVFIATGTGVAPFLSYCRSFPGTPPLCCLYGVRREADAIGLNSLQAVAPCHLAVSREAPTTTLHTHGRVTDLLDKLPLADDIHYYVCGLDAMIYEVSDWLEAHAVDSFNIHREVFFNDARNGN